MHSAGELMEQHLQKLNAKNRWKTKLINRYKRSTESESHKIEVDNGVRPLHWDTSPSPSPMGTDPINLFRMVQKWFWNQLQKL